MNKQGQQMMGGEVGTLHLFVVDAKGLPSSPSSDPLQWQVALHIDLVDFKTTTAPRSIGQGATKKPSNAPPMEAGALTWNESFNLPIHYTSSQSRVPLLDCTVTTPDQDMAISRQVDLAPLLLKPLQLTDINLALSTTTSSEQDDDTTSSSGPMLRIRLVFVTKSSPPQAVTSLLERLQDPPSTFPSAMPSGRLHVQFLSITKLRRTCVDVSEPVIGMEVMGDRQHHKVEFGGVCAAHGEYAIYFEAAEGSLTLASSQYTPMIRIYLFDKKGKEEGTATTTGDSSLDYVGMLQVPVLPCMVMQGHVLEGCFPLRTSLGQTKMGDLRLSLQYIPDHLVFTESTSPSLPGGMVTYQLKVGTFRGLYDPSFPGRKDPYVEVAVMKPAASRGSRHEKGEEEEDEAYSRARSTIAGDGFEQATWNEVLDVQLPSDTIMKGDLLAATLRLRLLSAAIMKDGEGAGRDDLLGEAYLPWPAPGSQNKIGLWYQLAHPSSPSLPIGYITLAFLGPTQTSIISPSSSITGFETEIIGTGNRPPMSPEKRSMVKRSPTQSNGHVPVLRCEQVEPCGPGVLICHVYAVQEADHQPRAGKKPQAINFTLDSVYAKVREARADDHFKGGSDGLEVDDTGSVDLWSNSDIDSMAAAGRPLRPFSQKVLFHPRDRRAARVGGPPAGKPSPHRAVGEQPVVVATVLAPLCYGPDSALVLYFGQGCGAQTSRWLKGVIDPRPAVALPGKQIQQWRLLGAVNRYPYEDPEDAMSVNTEEGEGGKKEACPAMLGRVHLSVQYVPHTVGVLKACVWDVELTAGPESSLASNTAASYIFHQLFLRLRAVPGQDYVSSTSRDAVLPTSAGEAKVAMSWGGEEMSLHIDTTALPLLKMADGSSLPYVEVSVLNNNPVVENYLGRCVVPLADTLSMSEDDSKTPRTLQLYNALTGQEAGKITLSFGFTNLYTPSKALAHTRSLSSGVVELDGLVVANDEEDLKLAHAVRDLKRLFYSLDRDGSGSVSQEELFAQGERLMELMQIVMRGRVQENEGMDLEGIVKDVFTSIDTDGNQSISWEEWCSFLDVLRLSGGKDQGPDLGLIKRNADAMRAHSFSGTKKDPLVLPSAPPGPPAGSPTRSTKYPPAFPSPVKLALPFTSPAGLRSPSLASKAPLVVPSKGAGIPPMRANEELTEEVAHLRQQVSQLQDEKRKADAKWRRDLETEKAKFRHELGVLIEAAKGRVEATPSATSARGYAFDTAGTEKGRDDEALLDLRVVNQALKTSQDQMRVQFQKLQTEHNSALMQLDLLKLQLREATESRNRSQFIEEEVRRLEAARRALEEGKVDESRGMVSEITVMKQEAEVLRAELAMHREMSSRTRCDVDDLKGLLDKEKHRTSELEALVVRLQRMINSFEQEKILRSNTKSIKDKKLEEEVKRATLKSKEREEADRKLNLAACQVTSGFRRFAQKTRSYRRLQAVISIQATVRSLLAYRRIVKLKKARLHAVNNIQRVWRGNVARRGARAKLRSVVLMQAAARGFMERAMAKTLIRNVDHQGAKSKGELLQLRKALKVLEARHEHYLDKHPQAKQREAGRRILQSLQQWSEHRKKTAGGVGHHSGSSLYDIGSIVSLDANGSEKVLATTYDEADLFRTPSTATSSASEGRGKADGKPPIASSEHPTFDYTLSPSIDSLPAAGKPPPVADDRPSFDFTLSPSLDSLPAATKPRDSSGTRLPLGSKDRLPTKDSIFVLSETESGGSLSVTGSATSSQENGTATGPPASSHQTPVSPLPKGNVTPKAYSQETSSSIGSLPFSMVEDAAKGLTGTDPSVMDGDQLVVAGDTVNLSTAAISPKAGTGAGPSSPTPPSLQVEVNTKSPVNSTSAGATTTPRMEGIQQQLKPSVLSPTQLANTASKDSFTLSESETAADLGAPREEPPTIITTAVIPPPEQTIVLGQDQPNVQMSYSLSESDVSQRESPELNSDIVKSAPAGGVAERDHADTPDPTRQESSHSSLALSDSTSSVAAAPTPMTPPRTTIANNTATSPPPTTTSATITTAKNPENHASPPAKPASEPVDTANEASSKASSPKQPAGEQVLSNNERENALTSPVKTPPRLSESGSITTTIADDVNNNNNMPTTPIDGGMAMNNEASMAKTSSPPPSTTTISPTATTSNNETVTSKSSPPPPIDGNQEAQSSASPKALPAAEANKPAAPTPAPPVVEKVANKQLVQGGLACVGKRARVRLDVDGEEDWLECKVLRFNEGTGMLEVNFEDIGTDDVEEIPYNPADVEIMD